MTTQAMVPEEKPVTTPTPISELRLLINIQYSMLCSGKSGFYQFDRNMSPNAISFTFVRCDKTSLEQSR